MKKQLVVLDTDFKIGDTVEPKVNEFYDEETRMVYMVIGYDICAVDENGTCTEYLVKVQGQTSELLYFYPDVIKKAK